MIAISVSKNDLNETKLKCPAVTFTETGIHLCPHVAVYL